MLDRTPDPLDPALSPPPWASRLPAWGRAILYVAGLWLLRNAAVTVTDGPTGFAITYPATGLVVYALFVTRRRRWPVPALIALGMGIAGSLAFGRTWAQAVALNGGAIAGSVGAAWLVVRLSGRPTMRTLRGALVLVLAPTLVIAVVSAASYAALSAAGAVFAGTRFWVFWAGSSLGILLATSLLVEWTEPAPPRPAAGSAALSVLGITLGLAGGLASLRLPGSPPSGDIILLPPLLWAALRFGQRGATAAITLGAVAYLAVGPWAASLGEPGAALAVQMFLGVGAISIFTVAAIGEERLAAEARRALLETAMDQSPDPAGIIAADGRVVWANEATARILGLPRAEIVGRDAWSLAGISREKAAALWKHAAGGGGPVVAAGAAGPLANGEISAAIVDVGGSKLMVSLLHDLTDRRRAEEASRLAALGTLAAGVAHEINNPLSYVVSNLAHLTNHLSSLPDRDGSRRAEVLEPLAEAEDGARRVREIVRQLGAFARADEGAGPVDPARVLRAALAMAGNEVRHRARIVTDIAITPPVIASESRLGQVFLNLLVNAAQAIPDGNAEQHVIQVTLSLQGDDVVLEVADTGRGMSLDTRSRIFEPFFTTRAPGGSGLGLAIAHSIVTRLGGRIDVESTPGAGSVFRVVLPAARGVSAPRPTAEFTPPPPTRRGATGSSRAPASPEPAPAPPPAPLRVLVVDDEPLVAKALARLLAGHEVVTAQSGRDALARVRAGERFDAVLCDLMMPELSGMDLHAAVAAADPGLAERFIFITGGAFTDSAREFLGRARNPRLEKPVDRRALHAALRHVAQA